MTLQEVSWTMELLLGRHCKWVSSAKLAAVQSTQARKPHQARYRPDLLIRRPPSLVLDRVAARPAAVGDCWASNYERTKPLDNVSLKVGLGLIAHLPQGHTPAHTRTSLPFPVLVLCAAGSSRLAHGPISDFMTQH